MRDRGTIAAGFSLVEVVIAMFILGVIAIALLPPLVNGIRFASEQALTATATRQVNALIEQARETHTCAALEALAPTAFRDGTPVVPITDPHDFSVGDDGFVCVAGEVNTIRLTATDPTGEVLASVTARILVDS